MKLLPRISDLTARGGIRMIADGTDSDMGKVEAISCVGGNGTRIHANMWITHNL